MYRVISSVLFVLVFVSSSYAFNEVCYDLGDGNCRFETIGLDGEIYSSYEADCPTYFDCEAEEEEINPADFNADGIVNFADYLILSRNFGKQTSEGDINGDGWVNFDDYLLFSSAYEG